MRCLVKVVAKKAGPGNRPAFLVGGLAGHFRRASQSIWIHGESFELFEAAEALISAVRRSAIQHRLVLTTGSPAVWTRLKTRYPDDAVLPVPLLFGPVLRRTRALLSPRLLILLGSDAGFGPRGVARMRGCGIPVAVVPPKASLETLRPLLPPAPAPGPAGQDWKVRGIAQRLGESLPGRALLAGLSRRAIPTWDALAARLGRPRTILCLGNGPSSEDPRLASIRHDCLFRVNWRWRQRGFLDKPHLVFVGSSQTLRRLSGCIFAFRSLALEQALLFENLLHLRVRCPPFFTMERAGSYACGPDRLARPTNGALMVVAAATLQPERLVIGGIDLFRHPAGRYPGAPEALNEPAAAHDPATDVALIRRALGEYPGEVVILGESLREALA